MGGSVALIVVLVGIVAGVAGLWVYRRQSAPKGRPEGPADARRVGQRNQVGQWGVRIAAPVRERACPQVRDLIGKEFVVQHKPVLPLKDCPFPRECQCHYVKLFDRRKEERRSGQERRQAQRFEDGHHDRRSGTDRRGKPVDWV